MKMIVRSAVGVCAAAMLFWAGFAAGQNKFGTPSSVIHISIIKWKDGVDDAQKKKALDGVKGMAAQIPGMKNVWTRAVRVQPRNEGCGMFDDVFAIEFADKAAADAYAKHPAHEKWTEYFLSIRAASISPQVSN